MVQNNSPQALVSQAKDGSIEALNTLLDAYKQHIYAICFALLNDREKAELAMQESVISVWKSIGNLKDSESFDNWLYHITYHVSNRMRGQKKSSSGIKTDKLFRRSASLSDLMLPQRYAEQDDLKERLAQIICSLSDRKREILVLYYYHQKSVEDIARITESSERKTQSLLYQAHDNVKEALYEKEQENGENYINTETPAVSLGSFITFYIDKNLPSAERINSIISHSRSEAYFSSGVAPVPLPVSKEEKIRPESAKKPQKAVSDSKPKHAGASTAEDSEPERKDYSSAVKIVAVVLIISILACIGLLVYNTYLSPEIKRENRAQGVDAGVTEQEEIATTAPTVEATAAATAAPTQADQSAVYKAYKGVLEENKDAIKNYNWQYRVDPAHPIAFADVMGDDTPEMVYLYATAVGDGGDMYMSMRVMTFDGSKAVEALKVDMQDNTRRIGGIYCITKIEGEKNLYSFSVTSPGQLRTQTAYRYVDNGDNTLKQEEAVLYNPNSGEQHIDGKDVSASEAESAYNDLAAKSNLLLLSSSDSRGISYASILNLKAENVAKTYEEAIAYLSDRI